MNDTIMLIGLFMTVIAIPAAINICIRKENNANIIMVALSMAIALVLIYIADQTRLYDPLSIFKKTLWLVPMLFVFVNGIIGLWKGKHVFLTIFFMILALALPVLYMLFVY